MSSFLEVFLDSFIGFNRLLHRLDNALFIEIYSSSSLDPSSDSLRELREHVDDEDFEARQCSSRENLRRVSIDPLD